jgi:hypothetical protein
MPSKARGISPCTGCAVAKSAACDGRMSRAVASGCLGYLRPIPAFGLRMRSTDWRGTALSSGIDCSCGWLLMEVCVSVRRSRCGAGIWILTVLG